ncbi:MAG: undecaprenyldiphospho-muramoylpentapeptide beta-N-acetylglucosaminyltransferase [Gammaproteobacteria bacterium]|nr:undecaprenyldiphospho-muramoylpentapeptide beta-N-acetylglucosaminyltransferase [Gammaproteobacteria bacterium]
MSGQAPIVIMAGGTGGHVFPALAVAERFQARRIPLVWMGTQRGLEARLVPPTGIPMEWIGVAGLRGTGWQRLLGAPAMLICALWQAASILRRIKPRLALGMGGFVSGPGGLMARCLGIPLIVHEQNALPGTTNRWLSHLASQVLEAFPGSFPPGRRALPVGNPVRPAIVALEEPRSRFTRHTGQPRLLVVGGSQGAAALNQMVPAALTLLEESERPSVRHQTGEKLYEITERHYRELGIGGQLSPFIEDMAEAYGWADLVLCRSGALTVAELAAAGVGSVLVPFPHAIGDHQTANARFLEQAGAALIRPQSALTPASLATVLRELLSDRDRLLGMAEAARQVAKLDAAEHIAQLCLGQIGVEN